MKSQETRLWTDLDGTAVAGMDLRDLPKRPLRGMPFFIEFMRGVNSQETIDVAAILTMRPSILNPYTSYEIRKFGLDEFFPDKSQVIHARGDTGKAKYIVDRSNEANVALIEDSVHLVAPKILKKFTGDEDTDRLITLAVPRNIKTQERVFEFAKSAINLYGKQSLEEFDYEASSLLANVGHRIMIGNSALNIVMLDAYSTDSGEHLGDFLSLESVRVANLSRRP
jgi:hypothetical protein